MRYSTAAETGKFIYYVEQLRRAQRKQKAGDESPIVLHDIEHYTKTVDDWLAARNAEWRKEHGA